MLSIVVKVLHIPGVGSIRPARQFGAARRQLQKYALVTTGHLKTLIFLLFTDPHEGKQSI